MYLSRDVYFTHKYSIDSNVQTRQNLSANLDSFISNRIVISVIVITNYNQPKVWFSGSEAPYLQSMQSRLVVVIPCAQDHFKINLTPQVHKVWNSYTNLGARLVQW